jgi:hypothetical protein
VNQTRPVTFLDGPTHDHDRLVVVLTIMQWTDVALRFLAQIVARYPGPTPVHIRIEEGHACIDSGHRVDVHPALVRDILATFGPTSVEGFGRRGGGA